MRIAILVFLGGAIGALFREALMLLIPSMNDHFPLDIFLANIIASLLLGVTAGLVSQKIIGARMNAFIATGIMGGLSTFSSFIYGALEIMREGSIPVAIVYLISSVLVGFIAVMVGYRFGAVFTKKSKNFN